MAPDPSEYYTYSHSGRYSGRLVRPPDAGPPDCCCSRGCHAERPCARLEYRHPRERTSVAGSDGTSRELFCAGPREQHRVLSNYKENSVKLYMHPLSTTSRPVRLFIHENGTDCEEQVVDLMRPCRRRSSDGHHRMGKKRAERWLDDVKNLKSWPQVNEAFYGFAASVKDKPFIAI